MPADLPVAAPDHAEVIREYLRDSMPPPSTERGVFPAADAHDALVALLAERQQDKQHIERLGGALREIAVEEGLVHGCRERHELRQIARAALAVEEDATP